ncbi:hypothetical protein O3P69_003328 [Scylla paramamosain]|uniref:DUF4470 domain-containing protein n=1 Tax=Scylla paramamosain TaxID=85552 RepID=A0AAW0UN02_SCYPA
MLCPHLTCLDQVVVAAVKIDGWSKCAKGIPQYIGRLIHAFDNQKKEAVKKDVLRLLLPGADLKHVLCTLHVTPDLCPRVLEFTLVEASPHILARDLLLLYLLLLAEAPEQSTLLYAHAEKHHHYHCFSSRRPGPQVVLVMYSPALDMEAHALLCNTLHNLLNMTHAAFMHETRGQVRVEAGSFPLV